MGYRDVLLRWLSDSPDYVRGMLEDLESAGYCIVETTWLRQMIDNSTLVSKPARPKD